MAVAIKVHDHPNKQFEQQSAQAFETEEAFDYSQRSQWLRAGVLGANDGLLSTASLIMGVGAVRTDQKTMILSGIAGLVAGACSMAIGEFVSVYSQYDTELEQIKREAVHGNKAKAELEAKKKKLPSPVKAALVSAFMFAIGALVPLLAAAFVKNYHVRLIAVTAAVSSALIGFGGLSAMLGKAPVIRSISRVLAGGWLAMGITFGLTKLAGSAVSF